MLASIHDADGLGRTVSVEGPQGITTYEYDEDSGLLTKQTLPNGVYTLYQYNNRGQMSGMAHYQPGIPDVLLAEYGDITYDAAGRRTGFSAQIAALPDYSGSYEFTYNAKGELTGEDFTPDDELLPPAERDYLYTAAGNCSNFNGVERRYNGANQLTQEWVNGQWVTVAQYDDRGNPTTYRDHELEYDQGNHLTAFDDTLTAGYSNDGRRIWKEVNGQRVFFIYDGDTLIGEMDEYGTTTAVNTIGATGLVSRLQGGSIGSAVYYLFDPLGNVLHRLDGDSDIVSSDVYDAWGKREYSNDLTGDPYGYKGQFGYYTDHETGLILCTYRYYDPETGRWLTKDPIGHEGGVNLYGYCANDPVNMMDPSGLKTYIFWRPVAINKYAPYGPFGHVGKHSGYPGYNGIKGSHVWLSTDNEDMISQLLKEPGNEHLRNKSVNLLSNVGYGPTGVMWGYKKNIAQWPCWEDAMLLELTPEQEKEIWQLAMNVDKGWKLNGRYWEGCGYNLMNQNCQDFVNSLLAKVESPTIPNSSTVVPPAGHSGNNYPEYYEIGPSGLLSPRREL